jgi:hypothetical protein
MFSTKEQIKINEQNEMWPQLKKLLENQSSVSLNDFLSSFEQKYSSLMQSIQQPILQTISQNDEKLNKNLNQYQLTQEQLSLNMNDFLNKYKNNSSHKGKLSENLLNNTLVKIFPTGEIINTSQTPHSGDFHLKRENKQDILFETKDYNKNVDLMEIKKFTDDCKKQNMHGILLSQNSGINKKENFKVEIIEKRIHVYVHQVDYSEDKIKTAVEIVDSICEIFQIQKEEEESEETPKQEFTISIEILEEIQKEINRFLQQKETYLSLLNTTHKHLVEEFKKFDFKILQVFLKNKDGKNKITPKIFECDKCDQIFYSKPSFGNHLKKHTNEIKKNTSSFL